MIRCYTKDEPVEPPDTPHKGPDEPVREPDDAPTTGPKAPVDEPEPTEPKRL